MSRTAAHLFLAAGIIFVITFFTKQSTTQFYAFFLATVAAFTQLGAQTLCLFGQEKLGAKSWLYWALAFGGAGVGAAVLLYSGLFAGELIEPKPGIYGQLFWYATIAFAAGATSFGCFLTYIRSVGDSIGKDHVGHIGKVTFLLVLLGAVAVGAAIAANVVVLPRVDLRNMPYMVYPISGTVLVAGVIGYLALRKYVKLINALEKWL